MLCDEIWSSPLPLWTTRCLFLIHDFFVSLPLSITATFPLYHFTELHYYIFYVVRLLSITTPRHCDFSVLLASTESSTDTLLRHFSLMSVTSLNFKSIFNFLLFFGTTLSFSTVLSYKLLIYTSPSWCSWWSFFPREHSLIIFLVVTIFLWYSCTTLDVCHPSLRFLFSFTLSFLLSTVYDLLFLHFNLCSLLCFDIRFCFFSDERYLRKVMILKWFWSCLQRLHLPSLTSKVVTMMKKGRRSSYMEYFPSTQLLYYCR